METTPEYTVAVPPTPELKLPGCRCGKCQMRLADYTTLDGMTGLVNFDHRVTVTTGKNCVALTCPDCGKVRYFKSERF